MGDSPGAKSRLGAVGTVLGTLLLVLAEFALLTGVYHLDDRADRRHEAYVAASSDLDAWRPGGVVAPVVSSLRTLASSGASGADQLRPAIRAFGARPSVDTATRLRRQVAQVGERAASAQRSVDRYAALIHASLLIFVSIGWFFWFRRLVRRQRGLERALTEAQLTSDSQQRLTALVRNSADVVTVMDADSTITFVSPALKSVLGYDPDFLTGRRLVDALQPADSETLTVLLTGTREGDQPVVFSAKHSDGRSRVLEGTLTNLLADPAVRGWVLTIRDVTERLAMQDELQHQASHDALTGLANRRLFGERLDHALRARSTTAESQVVIFLDLDDFKEVNDDHGHGIGDQLLVEVASRLSLTMREEDTSARLGGDEFAVLMEDTDLQTAQEYAARVSRALSTPVEVDGCHYPVRASIGIAEATPGATTGEETLRNADIAMYWAKDRGKGTVAVYEAGLHAEAQQRMALLKELQQAIEHSDQLVLHYQPTVDLASRRITGFEALVRWQHPERGLVPPSDFIPLAEQTGLIVPLGSWVLREACLAGVVLQSSGHQPTMSVNVAARQLVAPGFVSEVLEVLHDTGMPADRLVLEITESTLLDERERVVQALSTLRARGIRVAIDDFGTGYSSLAYLADLPVDVLKLDKSFVDRVCDEGRASLVDAIITMGQSLHLTTVAEGVERPEQATRLEKAHCMLGQGYLWSRPVELAAAGALLDAALPTDPGADALPSPEPPRSPARSASA